MRKSSLLLGIFLLMGGLVLTGNVLVAAEASKPAKASLDIVGMGLLKNYELEHAMARLLGEGPRTTFDANTIEDAAVILFSNLASDGYLQARIDVEAVLENGEKSGFTMESNLETPIPRNLSARAVKLRVKKGIRSTLGKVEFSGLKAMSRREGERFFLNENTFALFSRDTPYSPIRLQRSARNLQEDLQQRGYTEASVEAELIEQDPKTAEASVRVTVKEGLRWQVAGVEYQIEGGMRVPESMLSARRDQIWSHLWEQDVTGEIRRRFFRMGYPDVTISLKAVPHDPLVDQRPVTVMVHINPGKQATLGQVRFRGNEHTKESVLKRRVRSVPGHLLDPMALERARYRLSALGIFSKVDMHFEPPDGETRDVIFDLKESRRFEASALLGYGSYERFRGGVEVRQNNLWGRAHQSRLELVQSVKSSRGEYDYRVPELFGESVDGTAKLFGLQREEFVFLRQEYGGSVALQRPVPWIRAQGKLGFTYEKLRNKDNELATSASDDDDVDVASITAGLVMDRRDNPLRPRRGYRWFAQIEDASKDFGGSAEYQRMELGVAYHGGLGAGRWWHVGGSHGVITTWGSTDENLPVNKRFFPGGENSIRGYSSGEAAPRDVDGQFIGAKTYTLLSVELEQAIIDDWTLVVFSDALTSAATLKDYPLGDWLYTVGMGVRYQTIIGPIRLEYGRNFNRRVGDPSGTLLFSVGYPF